jgi:hypothetical protein
MRRLRDSVCFAKVIIHTQFISLIMYMSVIVLNLNNNLIISIIENSMLFIFAFCQIKFNIFLAAQGRHVQRNRSPHDS